MNIKVCTMEYLEEWFSLSPKQTCGAGVCGVVLVLFVCCYMRRRQHSCEKQEGKRKIEAKKDERAAAFELLRNSLQGITSADEETTSLPLSELIARLQTEEMNPVQVLKAFQEKALRVTDALNCVQLPISEAETWAQALSQRTEKGPLYGVPVSIKDHITIKGYDTTMGGCSTTLGKPYAEDSVLVKVLKKQGAVPFVFTNVPQALISCSCVNPVFGQTKNPCDHSRTPGGSSGGEAALVAAHGSVLGIGSDLGGSIRVPAAFCGICGLKPTAGRLSMKGLPCSNFDGQTAIEATVGPLARDVESLAVAMKALLVPYQWELDPSIVPYPFQDQIYEDRKPLKIGVLKDNGIYPPLPACSRAVDVAVDALQKSGHVVVQYKVPEMSTYKQIFTNSHFADGGKCFLDLLNGDEIIPDLSSLISTLRLPRIIRRVMVRVLKLIMSKENKERVFLDAVLGMGSVFEWWGNVVTAKVYRNLVMDDWRDKGIDVLICPVSACYALPYDIIDKVGSLTAFSFTSMFNVLNFPAGVVPVTKVTGEDLQKMCEYPAEGRVQKLLKQRMPEGGIGLPVAVQCAGLPYQEERVLRVMRDIQTSLKTSAKK